MVPFNISRGYVRSYSYRAALEIGDIIFVSFDVCLCFFGQLFQCQRALRRFAVVCSSDSGCDP